MAPFSFIPVRSLPTRYQSLEKRMSYHAENVLFQVSGQPSNNVNGIVGGSFTTSALSITSGQDPNGYNRVGQVYQGAVVGSGTSFSFNVGRKGTSGVAAFWNTNMPPNQNTFGHTAGDLNFAFIGRLTLNYVTIPEAGQAAKTVTATFNAGLAQGHSGSDNNWWFGATNSQASPSGGNQLLVTGIDQNGRPTTWTFLRGGNDDSTITVTQVQYETCLPDGTWQTTNGVSK